MDNLIGQLHTGDAFAMRKQMGGPRPGAGSRVPGQPAPPGAGGQQMMANEALAIFARMKQKQGN